MGIEARAMRGLLWVLIAHALCHAGAMDTVQDLAGGNSPEPSWMANGEFEASTGFGSPDAGWVHVEPPVQLMWSADNGCLHLKSNPKVDSFFCHDDPAGEAVWVISGNQVRQWGDQSQCLATEDGSDQVQLVECTSVSADDGWEVPQVGSAYGAIKSIKQGRCLAPDDGSGPRDVKLQDCATETMNWKVDQVDGRMGTCAVRWPTNAQGSQVTSGIPSHRVCFKSTGTSLGRWVDDVVFGSFETPAATGRLTTNLLGHGSSAADAEACALQCSDTGGCRGFNFNSKESSCELLKSSIADAADGDLDVAATDWAVFQPQVVTAGTNCVEACLPSTSTRLKYPQTGGKFGDSAGDLLPSAAARLFDEVLFPAPTSDVGDGGSTVQQECMAEADAITVEVTSYCEAAKTVQCTPDPSDQTKEKCKDTKEAHCRRMVLLPITYFGPDNADKREKCGHGSQQDTKVWHAARIAVDECTSVVNFKDFCGSAQANI